jgi:DNA-binding HxlR family transcriptional regulator
VSNRSYEQYCAAARALDLLGERWTILIVRDLLLGPRRYTDLQSGLPGIGPNVLSTRLKELQEAAIVQKTDLPPPAASTVYELTGLGGELRPLVRELTRWGLNVLGSPRPGEHFRVAWLLSGMQATFRPALAAGLHETYEYRIDGEVFNARVDDGQLEVRSGAAADPAFVVTTDIDTFMAMGAKMIAPDEAEAQGRATLVGDRDAGARSIAMLGPSFDEAESGGGIIGGIRDRLAASARDGVEAIIAFTVDDHHLRVELADGEVSVAEAPAPDAQATFETDLETVMAIGTGRMSPGDAVVAERATVGGDVDLLKRAFAPLVP